MSNFNIIFNQYNQFSRVQIYTSPRQLNYFTFLAFPKAIYVVTW